MATKRKYRYEDEETIDPYYKIFLDHLKPDGKSYVLQMNQMNKDDDKKKYEPSPSRNTDHNKKDKKKKKSNSKKETLDWTKLLLSCSSIDPYYRLYLEHLRLSNGSMVPDFNDKEPKEESHSSWHSQTNHRQSSSSSVFAYGDEHGDGSFEERLRQCLSKPFSRRKYDKLMALATQRKHMNRDKHLRKRSVSYATQVMGRSLLDNYPDLIKQIERADHCRGLTLLRGFFFWLKNLSHNGAFMPWKEPSLYDLSSVQSMTEDLI